MATMREVSEDLLTSLPRFFRCKRSDFPQYYSAITSEPCVVRSRAARLYPQREAGQSAIVDLKRVALRLGLFAREQRRSDEGLHDETPRMGSGKPGPDGPRLSARRNPGVAYTFEGQPHPSLARRPSHDRVSRGTIFTVAARARALII